MMFVRLIFVLVVSALCVKSEYTDPHCSGKQVIVHLFEWKWTDIADECERFLSKKGYCGVQVSPANEYAVIDKRPWWERYQPVSYKINTRSGNEAQFKDMVTRCKNVGVRIYVDAVVNHMAGLGRIGTGTGGSHFDSDNFDFPGVPYRREHFNPRSKCPSGSGNVDNYGDPNNVRNCFLVGLTDLNQNLEYVRDKIADYFNRLIAIGVAGFRVDASKHMWPADLKAIEERTNDLPEGGKPFFVHEVIDQNDGAVKVTEYEPYGYVTEMRYCQKIAWGINNFGQLNNVVDYGWGMTDSAHAFIFVDNHDNQRGHGGGGNLITHKQPRSYKLAQAFTLAYNYGFPRVMSSYFFQSTDQGPPHNDDYSIKDVTIEGDGSCGNGWVCEHRWPAIANMVWFRNAVAGTDLNHWRNENDEVSFSRGNKGFFAMAKQGHMDATLQTGLPAGQYCDLITDCKTKVTVDGSGNAHIVINDNETPILAFIVGGPSGPSNTHGSSGGTSAPVVTSGPAVTSGPVVTSAPVTSEPAPSGWARTIIMVQARTSTGQDVFIRGGIDHGHRNGCTNQASFSACAIPIKSHNLGTGSHYAGYNAWRQGDNFLDWYGPEPGQGSYHGASAKGTPAVWTTNQPGGHGYTPLNTYGEHYWLVDVDMDCSKTENGWFEIKALINNNWEHDMRVSGCGTESAPYASNNHWVKCGSKNVLHFNSGSCEISPISS